MINNTIIKRKVLKFLKENNLFNIFKDKRLYGIINCLNVELLINSLHSILFGKNISTSILKNELLKYSLFLEQEIVITNVKLNDAKLKNYLFNNGIVFATSKDIETMFNNISNKSDKHLYLVITKYLSLLYGYSEERYNNGRIYLNPEEFYTYWENIKEKHFKQLNRYDI